MGYIGAGISRFNTADELTVTGDAAIDTTTLVVDSTNNNVGIGTSSPQRNLHVHQPTASSSFIQLTNTATGSSTGDDGFRMGTDANSYAYVWQGENQHLAFATSNAEKMRVTSSGTVGIGVTSTAGGKLAIGGTGTSAAYQYMSNTGGTGYFGVSSSTGGGILIGDSAYSLVLGTGGATPLHFGTNNNIRATIDSSGRVGIGTTTIPTADSMVTVRKDGSANEFNILSGTSHASVINMGDADDYNIQRIKADNSSNSLQFQTNNAERMRVTSAGKLCLGTSSAVSSAMLSIVPADTNRIINTRSFNTSAQYHHVFQNNSSTFVGGITVSTTATAYNTSSDYRLKTAVTYDWDATTRLKQLRPARFKWIVDGDDAVTVDGFLAHEAQTVVPEAVTGTHNEVDDDGNPVYQGIDQSKLVPLLVKTIQELEARITALEAN